MTLVIGRKFGGAMLVASDTMITDIASGRVNSIPGQLKTIVVSRLVSISYAGAFPQSLDAIRRSKNLIDGGCDISQVASYLVSYSATHACDFIISYHEEDTPHLIKIRNGILSGDADAHWIGDPSLLPYLLSEEEKLLRILPDTDGDDSYGTREQHAFNHAFNSIFVARGSNPGGNVGGIPIINLGSRWGHTYNSFSFSKTMDSINLSTGWTEEQLQNQRSGLTEYSVNINSSAYRGSGVVGAYLHQARLGFLYDPISHEEPKKVTNVSLEDFATSIAESAKAAGGELENS